MPSKGSVVKKQTFKCTVLSEEQQKENCVININPLKDTRTDKLINCLLNQALKYIKNSEQTPKELREVLMYIYNEDSYLTLSLLMF